MAGPAEPYSDAESQESPPTRPGSIDSSQPTRMNRSSSGVSPARAGPSSSRGSHASNHPRHTFSRSSLRERGRAFSRSASSSASAGPLGRSLSQTRQPASNNWESLQELLDDPDEDEDDTSTHRDEQSTSSISRFDGGTSYRSIRSFFSNQPENRARSIGRSRDSEPPVSISGILSASPPAMDNMPATPKPPSVISEGDSEYSENRADTGQTKPSERNPLLGRTDQRASSKQRSSSRQGKLSIILALANTYI